MKARLLSLVIICLVVVLLAACGNSEKRSTTQAIQPETETSSTEYRQVNIPLYVCKFDESRGHEICWLIEPVSD